VITAGVNEEVGRRRWGYGSQPAIDPAGWRDLFAFAYYDEPKQKLKAVVFPHWVLLLPFVFAGIAPWIKQYSVKGMLIAMTLVALMLGLIIWLR
jgi:hypothetical protein